MKKVAGKVAVVTGGNSGIELVTPGIVLAEVKKAFEGLANRHTIGKVALTP